MRKTKHSYKLTAGVLQVMSTKEIKQRYRQAADVLQKVMSVDESMHSPEETDLNLHH